jgi:hypothetical protein
MRLLRIEIDHTTALYQYEIQHAILNFQLGAKP